MKSRSILLVLVAMALCASTAFAQTQDGAIDIITGAGFGCEASIQPGGTPGSLRVLARIAGGTGGGMTGAEFGITPLPAGWLAINTPNPAATVALGNLFLSNEDPDDPNTTGGMNISFGSCQDQNSPSAVMDAGNNYISLFTVTVIATSVASDHVLRVLQHSNPSNPQFPLRHMILCDSPVFTKVACAGGQFIINPTNPTCQVAVTERTWSEIKSLYH